MVERPQRPETLVTVTPNVIGVDAASQVNGGGIATCPVAATSPYWSGRLEKNIPCWPLPDAQPLRISKPPLPHWLLLPARHARKLYADQNTTVQEICASLHIGRNTLYRYIRDQRVFRNTHKR